MHQNTLLERNKFMNEMTKISVIIPTFNSEKYLKEAIESILNQTFQDFEIIVIDDNSVDNTIEILKSFNNPKIKILNGPCKGLVSALNLGLESARGEYIARMDSDDVSLPDRFEKQVKFLDEHQDCILCSGLIQFFDDNGLGNIEGRDMNYDETKIELLFATPVFHPTVMFRNKNFKEQNLRYNEEFKACEDFELWTRVSKNYNIKILPEVLLNYRKDNTNKATNVSADLIRNTHSKIVQNSFEYYGIDLPIDCCKIIDPYNYSIKMNKLKNIFYYLQIIHAFKVLIKINKNKNFFNEEILIIVLNNHLKRINRKLFNIRRFVKRIFRQEIK